MDEQGKAIERLASAAEALERTVAALESRFSTLEERIGSIVAAVDEGLTTEPPVAHAKGASRRTISAGALLEKHPASSGVTGESLECALRMLSIEQRIAVKAELARTGVLA